MRVFAKRLERSSFARLGVYAASLSGMHGCIVMEANGSTTVRV